MAVGPKVTDESYPGPKGSPTCRTCMWVGTEVEAAQALRAARFF